MCRSVRACVRVLRTSAGARGPLGEALDCQALASLLAPPGRPALGVDALLDAVPVRLRDAELVEQMAWWGTGRRGVTHSHPIRARAGGAVK